MWTRRERNMDMVSRAKPPSNKHTPGPWEISGSLIRIAEGQLIASCYDHLDMDIDYEEGEANKRLIAAAPALLEALESLTNNPHWAAVAFIPPELRKARQAANVLILEVRGVYGSEVPS